MTNRFKQLILLTNSLSINDIWAWWFRLLVIFEIQTTESPQSRAHQAVWLLYTANLLTVKQPSGAELEATVSGWGRLGFKALTSTAHRKWAAEPHPCSCQTSTAASGFHRTSSAVLQCCPIGSDQRYLICVTHFACCTSQKTHCHAGIACHSHATKSDTLDHFLQPTPSAPKQMCKIEFKFCWSKPWTKPLKQPGPLPLTMQTSLVTCSLLVLNKVHSMALPAYLKYPLEMALLDKICHYKLTQASLTMLTRLLHPNEFCSKFVAVFSPKMKIKMFPMFSHNWFKFLAIINFLLGLLHMPVQQQFTDFQGKFKPSYAIW